MRKITRDSVTAFYDAVYDDVPKNFSRNNVTVRVTGDGAEYLLHGNRIAWFDKTGFYISFCGYPTKTTKDRLNYIMREQAYPFTFYTKNFELFVYNYKTGKSFPVDSRETYSGTDFRVWDRS